MPGFGARKGRPLLTARGLELGLAKTLSHRLLALQLGVGGHEDVASVDLAALPWGFPKAPAYLSGSVHWAQDSWMVWTPGRGAVALGCDDSHWHRVATEQGLVRFCCFRPRSEKQALGSGAPGQKRDLGCSLFLQDQQPREGRRPRATAGSSVVRRRGSVKWQVGRCVRSRQKTAGLASHCSPNGKKNKQKQKHLRHRLRNTSVLSQALDAAVLGRRSQACCDPPPGSWDTVATPAQPHRHSPSHPSCPPGPPGLVCPLCHRNTLLLRSQRGRPPGAAEHLPGLPLTQPPTGRRPPWPHPAPGGRAQQPGWGTLPASPRPRPQAPGGPRPLPLGR